MKDRGPRQSAKAAPGGRASPRAIEKRRAARFFNEVLLGRAARAGDGRTERRRKRLLKELAQGAARGGKQKLKPIDVLLRIQELLDLGEPLPSIRKACPPPRPIEATAELVDGVKRLHQAYGFPAEAYRFVGIEEATLRRAGVPLGRPGVARAVPSARSSPRRSGAA